MITIIYQFKHNVTWHCRINQFFSFPEQLQIWIYVFLVGDHRYVHLLILRSTRKLSLQNSQIHKAIISECYSKYEVKIEYVTSNEFTQFNINKVQQQ